MFHSIWIYVLLILLRVSSDQHQCIAAQDSRQENQTVFIATSEWQEIPPDQPLPPGLRIRLNLKTGMKEAKLIGPDDVESDSQTAVLQLPTDDEQASSTDSHASHSNNVLDDIFEQAFNVSSDQLNNSDVKSHFRSYEELKAEFDAMNIKVQTDAEIIAKIVNELKQNSPDEFRTLVLLEDLDYLLHQVDTGKKFAEDGGFSLLAQILQSPHLGVKRAVFATLSAAIQGNNPAKVIALQNGTLDTLYRSLSWISRLQAPNTDSLKAIQTGLGTLGALLRDFPAAQRYFFSNHSLSASMSEVPPSPRSGFVLLSDLYDFTRLATQTDLSVNVRLRILTLFTDFARERTSAKQRAETPDDPIGSKLWELYSSFPFEAGFVASGWCTRLQDIFRTDLNFTGEVNSVNHDRLEKILTSLLHLDPVCGHALLGQVDDQDPEGLRADLLRLHEEYTGVGGSSRSEKSNADVPEQDAAAADDLDFFAHDMQQLIERLLDVNGTRQGQQEHDAEEL